MAQQTQPGGCHSVFHLSCAPLCETLRLVATKRSTRATKREANEHGVRAVEKMIQFRARIGVSTREEPRPRSKQKTKNIQTQIQTNVSRDSIVPLNAMTMQRYAMLQMLALSLPDYDLVFKLHLFGKSLCV